MIKANKGFSLVELAIVVTIIGVLLVATLDIGAGQIEMSRIKQTQEKLAKIEQAIKVYYKTNGRLPCPANGELPAAHASYGVSGWNNPSNATSNANCNGSNFAMPNTTVTGNPDGDVYIGVVPTVSLGLSDAYMLDSWGNKITYAVSRYCIDPDNWSDKNKYKWRSTAAANDGGNIKINNTAGTIGQEIPNALFILVSHGKDGVGAYRRAGASRIFGTPATSPAEKENANYTVDGVPTNDNAVFVDGFINDGNAAPGGISTYFDDITRWNTAAVFDDSVVEAVDDYEGEIVGTPVYGEKTENNFEDNSYVTPAIVIPNEAKYILVEGSCRAASAGGSGSGRSYLYLEFWNSGVLTLSSKVCHTEIGAYSIITTGDIFQRIPDGTTEIKLWQKWAGNSEGNPQTPDEKRVKISHKYTFFK